MLNKNLSQSKPFCFSLATQKRQQIERNETNADIREAINAGSAPRFVVSRLEWRLANGLNLSREVSQ